MSKRPTRKRQREPSPASSASSISLGSTWYDSTKRKVRRKSEHETERRRSENRIEEVPREEKGKAEARDYPGTAYGETLSAQTKSNLPRPPRANLPQCAHNDSGYLSESADNSVASYLKPYSPLARPPVAAFCFVPSASSSEDNRTGGRAYSPSSIPPTPEEIDEDSYVETMVDLESDGQTTEDLTRIIQKSPQLLFPTPYSYHQAAPVSPVSSRSLQRTRHALGQAGSSTAPGTKEWHRAQGAHAGGSPDYETFRKRSSEHVRFAGIGKQVTFATSAGHRESIEPEQVNDRASFPRSRSTSVLSSRFTPSPPSGAYPQLLETTPVPRKTRRSEVVEELLSEIEATYAAPPQTPSRRALLARVSPKPSDMPLLSRLGLGAVLDRLGAKYGFTQELVGEVYSVEEGIAGTELVLKEMRAQVEKVLCRRASSVIEGDYAIQNSAAFRPGPKPDPEHVAKRKRFIAQQYVFDGKHSTIKKTITWDDVSKGTGLHEASSKGIRLSQSQTPGFSDKSYTPTPAARSLPSALKSSASSRASLASSQSRSLSQLKKEVVLLPPTTQPSTPSTLANPAPRLPEKSTPAPQRVQSLPNVINLASGPTSDDNDRPGHTETMLAGAGTRRPTTGEDAPGRPSASIVDPLDHKSKVPSRPLFLPDSDDERERLEEHPDSDAWLTRASPGRHSPSPVPVPGPGLARTPPPDVDGAPPEVVPPQVSRPPKDASTHSVITIPSTSSHVAGSTVSVVPTPSTPSPRPKGGPVRRHKRRRSSVGIQTLPEGELEWLAGMEVDASMSAIDISREWAGASSPMRGQAGAAARDAIPQQEIHEPLGTSFLEEFEGRQAEAEDRERPTRADSVGPFSDADEGAVEDSNAERISANEDPPPEPEQNGKTGHDSSSPEPIPPRDQSQDPRSSPEPISIDHYAGMTEDIQQSEGNFASHPKPSACTNTKPYGEEFTARVSALRASVSQPVNPQAAPFPFKLRSEPDPKPISASQPDRARSRMYTPQPLPRQDLKAAPTLGRSMYGDTDVQEGATKRAVEQDGNVLRAAPTLGRSMVWDSGSGNGGAGKSKSTEDLEGTESTKVVREEPLQSSERSQPGLASTPPPPSLPASKGARLSSAVTKPPSNSQPPKVPSPAPQPQLSPIFRPSTPIQEHGESASAGPSTTLDATTQHIDAEAASNDQGGSGGYNATPAYESETPDAPADLANIKSQSQSTKSHSDSVKPKSVATTDYDAEYGSVLDVPSATPRPESREPTHITVSSSPTNPGGWTLEPAHASTPQFQTTLPRSAVPVLHIDSPPTRRERPRVRRSSLAPSPTRPMSLVSLGKRRRSSVAPAQSQTSPFPASKKIRREYDTIEPGAFPRDTRAHEDTFDQRGNRVWIPTRPTMQRAPQGVGVKKVVRPNKRRIVSDGSDAEQDYVPERRATQENGVMAEVADGQVNGTVENSVAPDGQEQGPDAAPIEEDFTEIPETPEVGPFVEYAESILEAVAKPALPVAGPSGAPALAVEPPTPVIAQPSPAMSALQSREQSRASPFLTFSSKRPRSSRSKRKSELSGFQFTPAQNPNRTRLSLGSRSGPAVEQVSERDAQILQKAGLKPTLKRLSQVHGFTTEVVADVYQEHGDLKEAEEALKEMKQSATRTRIKIARRMSLRGSIVEASHGPEQELGSTEEEAEGDVFSRFGATRTRREILFGN
ncbi:hypothetical protein FRC10_005564 [Ceratobasidium sp. 414]|nr:hypothetical protein FRC10_005564 [Ceratobasidium sp. 414]